MSDINFEDFLKLRIFFFVCLLFLSLGEIYYLTFPERKSPTESMVLGLKTLGWTGRQIYSKVCKSPLNRNPLETEKNMKLFFQFKFLFNKF